jgi:hypothetical protein
VLCVCVCEGGVARGAPITSVYYPLSAKFKSCDVLVALRTSCHFTLNYRVAHSEFAFILDRKKKDIWK